MKLFHRIGQGNIVGTILLLVATVQVSLSQTVEKNAEGERIVKYEDGTWRYFEGKDSLLLKDDKGKKADKMPKPISPEIYSCRSAI